MTAKLIGLSVSPYTEKAKWALDHHRLPYDYHEHVVIFGMPALRFQTRRFTGDVTVPVLIDGATRLLDSFDIAHFADERGSAAKLFPANATAELERYRALSEEAMDAGRAFTLPKVGADREARVESIPPIFPKALTPVVLPMVSVGLHYIYHEFKVNLKAPEREEERMRVVLLKLREDLKACGGQYLLGSFSFADVLMAVVLQFVQPVAQEYLAIGPATRRCWTNAKLKAEFADLIQWRDTLYQKHRIAGKA